MSSKSQSERSESKRSASSASSSGSVKKKGSKKLPGDSHKPKNNEMKKSDNNTQLQDETSKFRIRIEKVGKDVTIAHLLEIFGTLAEP